MSHPEGRERPAPRRETAISDQPLEPCLISPHRDPEVVAAEQELTEVRPLGSCAKGCGGIIHATTCVRDGRVERRQYCTNEECDGIIPSRLGAELTGTTVDLPQPPPPSSLGGIATGNDLDPPPCPMGDTA